MPDQVRHDRLTDFMADSNYYFLKIPPNPPLPAPGREKTPKGGVMLFPFSKGGQRGLFDLQFSHAGRQQSWRKGDRWDYRTKSEKKKEG